MKPICLSLVAQDPVHESYTEDDYEIINLAESFLHLWNTYTANAAGPLVSTFHRSSSTLSIYFTMLFGICLPAKPPTASKQQRPQPEYCSQNTGIVSLDQGVPCLSPGAVVRTIVAVRRHYIQGGFVLAHRR